MSPDRLGPGRALAEKATPMKTPTTPDRPADPTERRDFGVAAVLALPAGAAGPLEVYVDLASAPVRVRTRGGWGEAETWTVAGPLLRERVLSGVAPLLAAGWRTDGTFAAAARWDVSAVAGPDLYRGCWLRLCRGAA